MIEVHWFAALGWLVGAFTMGWALAMRKANKLLLELDEKLDKAIGMAKAVEKMASETGASVRTQAARVDDLRKKHL